MENIKTAKINWPSSIPFFLMHLLPFGVFFTGFTWFSLLLCLGLYAIRMWFVTVGYHRYFAHRTFKLGRIAQFILAFGAMTSAQKGVLWWAGHHREHHQYSDTESDVHSPIRGFWWSHVGWILSDKFKATEMDRMKDFASFPELRWLDRHPLIPPTILAVTVLILWGWTALFIGFFLSTVLVYHGTFCINSMAHVFGRRRFVTGDTSRNSFLLAMITGGEGWHNNHHHYCASANQGFYWWEIDLNFYVLKFLSWIRIVRDLRTTPKAVLALNRLKDGVFDRGILQAKIRKAQASLERAQRRGGAYYEKKLVEFDKLLATASRAKKFSA